MVWIDRMKGIALCWVVLCHIVENIAGGEYIANPTVPWPPLAERIGQLRPVSGHGIFDIPLTILRDLGWFGDQGVTLFILLSGFGLTWGLLARGAPETLDAGTFFKRRFARIYPLWWGAHILFLPTGLFLMAGGLSTGDVCFFTDVFGMRFFPQCFYYFSPAWWYIGLLVQLYAVYPLLWKLLRSKGPTMFLLYAGVIGFTSIALGPFLFHNAYLDAWQRGAFFVTRLPEFALGMAAASWFFANPIRFEGTLRKPVTLLLAVIGYAVGTGLSLFLPGMIVAPVLLGGSAFVLLYSLCVRGSYLAFIGRNSYALYLTHYPFVHTLVPRAGAPVGQAFGIVLSLLATVLSAWLLEHGVACLRAEITLWRQRAGKRGVFAYIACIICIVFALPLLGEAAVRRFDPQEVLGWGERSSLQPDTRFGWTLIPSRTTHLRWESYDYRVTANEWGFPAPALPQAKPKNALRILVTGDAYSSAEGVDTNDAWPRFLQDDLARALPHRTVQVANFAITGYGPNEEAAVVATFAPQLRPDIVLIEMFVNDVSDVLTPDAVFSGWIGFGLPSPNGIRAFLHQTQLRRYFFLRVTEPLVANLRHQPDPEGYSLGNFLFLKRGHAEFDTVGVTKTAQRYAQIARIAASVHARVLVLLVPAPVQVCDRSALAYYPNFVDLYDTQQYDFALPEQRAARIASESGVPVQDLGDALRRLPQCPYQPLNMHFTPAGHQAMATIASQAIQALENGR